MRSPLPPARRPFPWHSLLLAVFLVTFSLLALSALDGVPFHPDESTQIFMSSDVELFFREPAATFWQPEKAGDLRQHYRLMDAPLTRTLIGLFRLATRTPALPADWDWSKTWAANQAAGALPDERTLWVSRLAAAWLLPVSLLLVYAIGRELGGRGAGWAALLLASGNALLLLHARRAMAESALVAASLLAVWAMLRWKKHPWLLAVPLALAFNAKQSAAVLALPALAALLWQPCCWKTKLSQLALCGLLFGGMTLALNPYLWAHPLQAAAAAVQARADFTSTQAGQMTALGAGLPSGLPERLAAVLVQVILAPPALADVGNYLQQTRAVADAYLANPLHTLLRGLTGGGVMLALALLGLLLAGLRVCQADAGVRRSIILLGLVTAATCLALGWMIPVPFQRYYILLAPLACIWAGFGLSETARRFLRQIP